MRTDPIVADGDHVAAGALFVGVWPKAGFSGIAYRLAKLTAPRSGVLALIAALFYLV